MLPCSHPPHSASAPVPSFFALVVRFLNSLVAPLTISSPFFFNSFARLFARSFPANELLIQIVDLLAKSARLALRLPDNMGRSARAGSQKSSSAASASSAKSLPTASASALVVASRASVTELRLMFAAAEATGTTMDFEMLPGPIGSGKKDGGSGPGMRNNRARWSYINARSKRSGYWS